MRIIVFLFMALTFSAIAQDDPREKLNTIKGQLLQAYQLKPFEYDANALAGMDPQEARIVLARMISDYTDRTLRDFLSTSSLPDLVVPPKEAAYQKTLEVLQGNTLEDLVHPIFLENFNKEFKLRLNAIIEDPRVETYLTTRILVEDMKQNRKDIEALKANVSKPQASTQTFMDIPMATQENMTLAALLLSCFSLLVAMRKSSAPRVKKVKKDSRS